MRRWLALIFVIFCSMMVVVYETSASDKRFFLPEPLGGVKIVLDAGHGGQDGGASNGDVIEKDITLAITKKVARQLTRLGAEVILTRSTDGDVLSEHAPSEQFSTNRERKKQDIFLREALVKKHEPDLFITIHANAIPNSKWRGAQVFYHESGHPNGENLAKAIQQTIRETMENTDREALSIKQIYLLKKVEVPAALVETGFISNEEERKLLATDSYQDKMAFAIARGIENFINVKID
ncbi:N-acetylmuramoyl-L-alanine amidase [Lysinibacillus sp. 2017]|uniref:N-acetylmuramoyl-L-alanine amidase n=1 Tax=unclassified Lysinibacillus TaxID=2636778 RepID=UPI000D528B0A|nr:MULTISPECIES: N-acetylmuramoyl-L-alanine amidase [unclassified Lysinibacillus]AWE09048.1 N-acetylmuramoyl-L-alanine amidase [Lysinibacillus sp. 2017]TGN35872.1 N-acetylmuramoyl-L-alanine amidase [Lysinibacillus sp. S2017]